MDDPDTILMNAIQAVDDEESKSREDTAPKEANVEGESNKAPNTSNQPAFMSLAAESHKEPEKKPQKM